MTKNQKQIRIKDRFPSTHYFVYKEKQYPIKIEFFKLSSEYFQANQSEIEYIHNIQLLDEESGEELNISENEVKQFIQYVEQEPISLSNENIVSLYYLAAKFGVKSLIEDIEEYIKEYQNDVIVEILLIHQNDPKFKTEIYENVIASNLQNYLKNFPLLKLNFPILYRILDKSDNQSNKKDDKNFEKDKVDFYFKCLDKFGRQSSLLFKNVKNLSTENLNTLVSKYSEIFDFQFIHPSLIKNLIETQNKMEKNIREKENEIIKQKQIIEQKNNEIEKLKNDSKNKESKLINQIECLKGEIQKIKEESERRFSDQKIKEKEEKNKLEIEIVKNSKLESQIKSIRKSEQSRALSNVLVFEQPGDLEKGGIVKYIDDNFSKNDRIDKIDVYFKMGYDFRHYNNLKSSSISNLPDFQYKKSFKYILFDFKNMKIEITSYSIKSSHWDQNCSHIRSWTIEISDDLKRWETIDEHSNSSELNGTSISRAFKVKPNHFTRYCLLKSTADCYGHGIWGLEIGYVEFYGHLKTN